MNEPTFAEKCYAEERYTMQLFTKCNEIMGCDERKWREPGFAWAVKDAWTDDYDASVEVVMNPDFPPMTREQADAILALGFGQIYESQGERGTNWTRSHVGKCSPRESRDEKGTIYVLQKNLDETREQLRLYLQGQINP